MFHINGYVVLNKGISDYRSTILRQTEYLKHNSTSSKGYLIYDSRRTDSQRSQVHHPHRPDALHCFGEALSQEQKPVSATCQSSLRTFASIKFAEHIASYSPGSTLPVGGGPAEDGLGGMRSEGGTDEVIEMGASSFRLPALLA